MNAKTLNKLKKSYNIVILYIYNRIDSSYEYLSKKYDNSSMVIMPIDEKDYTLDNIFITPAYCIYKNNTVDVLYTDDIKDVERNLNRVFN